MSTYRLKIKCNNAQLEVCAKDGSLLAYELDRYLECFLNRKIESAPYITQTRISKQKEQFNYTESVNLQAKQETQNLVAPQYQQPVQQEQTIVQQPQYQQDNTVKDIANNVVKPVQEAYISLEDFINSNKSTDIFSEFVICAYYFKRILNITTYSVKTLNSKFYPATGKLIDLSIVDEARMRGFIDTVEENGSLKYTLSADGESYFINQLRG